MSQKAVRILGIDPGLNHTGYGFVDFVPGHFTYVASGVLMYRQASFLTGLDSFLSPCRL